MSSPADMLRRISDRVPPLTYLFIPLVKLDDRRRGGALHQQMQANIDIFCTPEQKADSSYIRRLKRDMWYSFIRYYCPFNEYFLFRFPRLSPAGRREFVTNYEMLRCCSKLSPKKTRSLFRNKWESYKLFQKYYGRDAMPVTAQTTEDELTAFIKKHPRFIAKPLTSSCGRGVRLVDTAAEPVEPARLLEELRSQDAILEEPIVQSQAMARFHPQSVNTIRCVTFLKGGQVHILFTFFRMGRGGSVVDNAGAGGIFAAIDPDSGIVCSAGISKTATDSWLFHPDTNEQIIGAHIPLWDQLKSLVSELAQIIPEQPYVGWDLALTDDGWVLVEGNNAAQLSCIQSIAQRGIRPLLSQYFDL